MKKPTKKIIFYIGNSYNFRSTLIGHLYEISQVYPVILLSEKLDSETEKALKNKELFPKLEKIIPVNFFTSKNNLFFNNIRVYRLSKNIIKQYKPDVVILPSDMSYLFGLYLLRFAKKINALKIAIQTCSVENEAMSAEWVDLTNAALRFPQFFPLWLRKIFVKCRKYFGHFVFYWILPLLVGEKPFLGKSSYILRKGKSGMREIDYQIVFSEKDYDLFLKDGVPKKRLYVLAHPLIRRSREIFNKIYLNKLKEYKKNTKIISLMMPEDNVLGFEKNDHHLIISKKDREKNHIEIIKLISQILFDWEIYIKPHPDTKNFSQFKKDLELISKNIKVTDPEEPADKYIEMADVIVSLPLSISTVLFTAFLQCPQKPIISLDFHQEFLGDYYKNFNGIDYIDNKEKFVDTLKAIKNNTYQKKHEKKNDKSGKFFIDTNEAIETLYTKKFLHPKINK